MECGAFGKRIEGSTSATGAFFTRACDIKCSRKHFTVNRFDGVSEKKYIALGDE